MTELKTKRTGQSVASFLNAIEDNRVRVDCKACLYINQLDDIDRSVLQTLMEGSVAHMRSKYPTD